MKENKSCLISVILPVYNGEAFLNESIQSVLSQSFKNFEFIIINDASKDNSLKIIEKYKNKDKRIKLINNKINKGFSGAYNSGLKVAKGKYVAICTQDDVFHPKRFEIQYKYLEENHHIFLLGTSAIYIDEKGNEIRRFRKYDDYKLLAWRLRKSNGIIWPSIMFRNEGNNSLDEFFEYHLYYRVLKKGNNLTNIPNFLVKMRVHDNAMSTYDKERQIILRDKVIDKFKDINYNLSFWDRIIFTLKLSIHYIKTFREKRVLRI